MREGAAASVLFIRGVFQVRLERQTFLVFIFEMSPDLFSNGHDFVIINEATGL